MKWPETLTLMRHDVSDYNTLKKVREDTPLYKAFRIAYDTNPETEETKRLAIEVHQAFSLETASHDIPLTETKDAAAVEVGRKLKDYIKVPNVIFVSPYKRTIQTLERVMQGWPDLRTVPVIEEERIREQDMGLAFLFNDWRVFNTIYPEQRKLHDSQGEYWYRYPQGENIPDVRERLRSWVTTLTREFADKDVFAVKHHLGILSLRANLERLGANDFLRMNEFEKPINAGITIYRGDKNQGRNGRLVLDIYNLKLYK